MNKVKSILVSALALTSLVGCSDFLKENPKTFLTPDNYFTTSEQMQAAVNGLYSYMDDIFDGDIEVGTHRFIFLEYMSGYGERPRTATSFYLTEANLLSVTEENNNLEALWRTAYTAIENANSTIAGMEAYKAEVSAEFRNQLLGEAYFMRAYHYFNLVRLWGQVPLKTAPTTELSSVQIPLSSTEDVYAQIESDLVNAEELMKDLSWVKTDGHVSLGAVKALLSKVYLTMAGYPLSLGKDYYAKAYNKASEIVAKKAYSLYPDYRSMRDNANSNSGEWILCIQREQDKAGSPVHNDMLPYPEPSAEISKNSAYGGALAPTVEFYNSYDADDLRRADYGYYTTKENALDGSGEVDLGRPYIYKYWDSNCASTAKSGANYAVLRYADVLLTLAEAKVMADGGTTSDNTAIEAYYQVRKRAMPAEAKPASLDFNTVYKERLWELCFETQTWFDMQRTRKALNPVTGKVIDLIGYQTPGHEAAFAEKDLLFPYPLREVRLNPNLKR